MAQAITCDGPPHGDEPVPAVLVITNVPQAEVSGLCIDCATGFALAWLQAMAPEMVAKPPAAAKPPARTRKPAAPKGGSTDGTKPAPRPRAAAGKRPPDGDTGD